MIDKIIWIIKISFIVFSIFFFFNIDFSELNFFNYNQIIAILILIIFHLFRILRFYVIFYFLNNKINFFSLVEIYYIGLYLGIITPGRLGEFYRIKLINDLNIPKLSNYNFVLIEKITDIFSLICFIFLLLITGFYTLNLQTIVLFFIFVLVGIFFIKNGYHFFTYSVKKILSFSQKFKKKKIFKLFFKNNYFENLSNKKLIFLFFLTMIIWLIFIFAVHIGINSNFNINFLETTVKKVVDFAKANNENYDHRWLNLHGMDAVLASMDEKSEKKELSKPKKDCEKIKQKTIDDYFNGFTEYLKSLKK